MALFWWQKQQQQLRALEERHKQFAERRVLSQRLDYLAKYSNDIILLVDEKGRIIDFNDRALDAYGYSAAEFLQLSIFDLRRNDPQAQIAGDLEKIHELGAMRFEATHFRKDGVSFPVEISVRVVEIGGKLFQQSIVRDISERKMAEEKLRQQKRFIRQVIDSDPSLIFVKDADGRFLLANAAMAKSYGQTTEGIVGMHNADFISDPELLAAYERAGREVIESRRERVAIETGLMSDGRKHFFHTIRKPLQQEDGSIGVLTIAMDITDLKAAEVRFEAEHARLHTLVQTMPELVWLKDTNGVYLDCNSQFERFFGAREDEIVGKTDYDFVDKELADFFRQKDIEATLAGKPCVNEEWVSYPEGGQRVLLETIKTPVRDEAGKLIGVMGIARDITERKRIEEELRFKNTLLTTEHEASIEGVLIVDGNGRITSHNRRFVAMWNIAADIAGAELCTQVLPSILDQLAEPDSVADKVRHLGELRDETSRDEIELRDGRMFEYYTTPMISPQNEHYGRIWYFRDLTEQKLAARNLARSYEKLQRLALRMENTRADERAKIALNLHDEMGATLAAMKMRVAWLASRLPAGMPELSEETAQISELVSGGIQTMRRIVSELKPKLLSDTGLAAAIADYVRRFRKHSDIECILVLPETELTFNEDQSLAIFRIFQEALNNVVKHAQASKVSIVFTERGDTLSMTVKDNGIGFDPAIRKEASFGLLGIRERALMVGGKVRISSAPGKGTRVSVSIPHPAGRAADADAQSLAMGIAISLGAQ